MRKVKFLFFAMLLGVACTGIYSCGGGDDDEVKPSTQEETKTETIVGSYYCDEGCSAYLSFSSTKVTWKYDDTNGNILHDISGVDYTLEGSTFSFYADGTKYTGTWSGDKIVLKGKTYTKHSF